MRRPHPDNVSGTPPPVQDDLVIIAVMGLTGVGKSNFISLLGGQHCQTHEASAVGSALASETKVIDWFSCKRQGRTICLIDTPGFDDSVMSNSKVLQMIAEALSALFKENKAVDGVIYLHRITDNRMGAHAKENLKLFEKLCGAEAMNRVALVTTMWDAFNPKVPGFTREDFKKREDQLQCQHWREMIKEGAITFQSENTQASAFCVLDYIINQSKAKGSNRKGLQIQEELVTQSMVLGSTGAGKLIAEDFTRTRQELEAGMTDLQSRLEKATTRSERVQVEVELEKCTKQASDIKEEQAKFTSWQWKLLIVQGAMAAAFIIKIMAEWS